MNKITRIITWLALFAEIFVLWGVFVKLLEFMSLNAVPYDFSKNFLIFLIVRVLFSAALVTFLFRTHKRDTSADPRALMWLALFMGILALWLIFGGMDTVLGDTPDKFQALGVLFSVWGFAGIFFTIFNQNKSTEALRKETALLAKETKRYAEIEEFKQGISVLDELRKRDYELSLAFIETKQTNTPQIDERYLEVIATLCKRVTLYDRRREKMMDFFDQKYLTKYDDPEPTLTELLARIRVSSNEAISPGSTASPEDKQGS